MEFPPLPPLPQSRKNAYSHGFVSGALTEAVRPGAGGPPGGHYSFQIVDATEAGNPQVRVYDGLVNDKLPDGMGSDDYFLPATDGMTIYVGVTYDTDTFEITSRYLNTGDPPDDSFGSFSIIIGGAAVTTNPDGSASVQPFNAHCGDIFFTFDFGALNAKPAIKCTPFTDWVEIPQQE